MRGPDPTYAGDPHGPPLGVHGAAPEDVVEFLEQVLSSGPIDTITVWQETLEGRFKLRTLPVKSIDPVELSAALSRIVTSFAQGKGRRTSFIVEAFAGAESKGCCPIVRDVPPTLNSQHTEPPTEAGVLALTMRHQEQTMRTAHVMQDALAGHLTRELRDARVRIKQLEGERDAVALRMRDVIVQQVDQEHMRAVNHQNLQAKQFLFETLIGQLPNIIQRFTAVEVIEQMKLFAVGLEPAQLAAFGAVLKPAQAESLSKLIVSLQPKNVLPEPEKKE